MNIKEIIKKIIPLKKKPIGIWDEGHATAEPAPKEETGIWDEGEELKEDKKKPKSANKCGII